MDLRASPFSQVHFLILGGMKDHFCRPLGPFVVQLLLLIRKKLYDKFYFRGGGAVPVLLFLLANYFETLLM